MIAAIVDTHTIIWYIFADKRLSSTARNLIDEAAERGEQIGVSSMTLLEMVYLIEKGKIAAESFSRLTKALEGPESALVEVPVDLAIARSLSRVDAGQVPDLPDRTIAATALHLGVPVISRDSRISCCLLSRQSDSSNCALLFPHI
jgi:PIN domain nuclease of toxin-antitoxin system